MNLDMAARQVVFDGAADLVLEGIQLGGHVEVQVEPAMIHALQADRDFTLLDGLPYTGETRHAACAHKSTAGPRDTASSN